MEPAKSAPIDRVLCNIESLIAATKALEARRADYGTEAIQKVHEAFKSEFDAFEDGLDTMKDAIRDLDNQTYRGADDFSFEEASGKTHLGTLGMRKQYEAVCNTRYRFEIAIPHGNASFLLDPLRDLQEALLKARKAVRADARNRPKRQPTTEITKPLTDSQQAAYDLIRDEGPLLGRQIVNRLGIGCESSFTSHYVPALKLHGVKNRRGLGYYIDSPE